MHDSFGVRRYQRFRHLYADVQHFLDAHGVPGDVLLQALAFELFHHDERMPVVVFNAVDGADIGVVQLRCRPRLARETLQRFGVASQIFWNKFQGDMPPELQVFRLVDHAHTTAPELSEDTVMGYLLADHESA